MAEENPFANALRPERGGLPGFIGGMMGVPTTDQAQGGATGSALAAIANLRSSGKTTQEAAMEFFKTPQGQEFFTNAGPDGLKNLAGGLSQMQPPSPTMNNIAPGGMLTSTDQNGKTSIAASNPQQFPNQVLGPQDQLRGGKGDLLAENPNQKGEVPAAVRSFTFFTDLAKLPEAEKRRLAAIQADPTKGGPNSVMSEAADKLGTDFGVDPRTVEAIKAGTLKVIPLKNELGQDTGDITVYDLSNPGAGAQLIRANRPNTSIPSAVPPPLPGVNPETGAGVGTLPPVKPDAPMKSSSIPSSNPKYFGDKSSMFLASGPIAKGLSGASNLTELIDPTKIIPEGSKASDRQNLINTLRSDLTSMGQMGEGWVNKGVVDGYLNLAPSGDVFETPHEGIKRAIRLSEHVQQEIDAQAEVYADKTLPIEQRKKAQSIIQGWQRVQRDLPSPDELSKMEGAIRAGTAGAPTISGAIKEVSDMAGKALTSGKKQLNQVQSDQGLGDKQPNIDAMNSPQELLTVEPRSLSRENKIKYLRKLDALNKKGSNGSTQP